MATEAVSIADRSTLQRQGSSTASSSAADVGHRWSRREDLALASAVERVGDRAWTSVSRLVVPLADGNSDWRLLTARACSVRYSELQLTFAAERGEIKAAKKPEPKESLVQRLTRDRIAELRQLLESVAERYRQAKSLPTSDTAAMPSAPSTLSNRRRGADGVFVVSDAELAGLFADDKAAGSTKRFPRKSLNIDGEESSPAGNASEAEPMTSPTSAARAFADEDDVDEEFGEESAATSLSASLNASTASVTLPAAAVAAAATSVGAESVASAAAASAASDDHEATQSIEASTAAPETPSAPVAAAAAAAAAVAAVTPPTVTGKEFVDSPEPSDAKAVKQWRKQILSVLRTTMSHKHGSVFLHPVSDDIAPGYTKVVHRPMDLTTLKRLVDSGEISSTRQFLSRLYLIFFNAVMYNNADQPVHSMALEIWADTCVTVNEMLSRIDSSGGVAGVGGSGGSDGGELNLGDAADGSEPGDSGSHSHLAKVLRHHHARRSEQFQLLQHPHHHVVLHHSVSQGSGDAAATDQMQRRRTASHSSSNAAATAAAAAPGLEESAGRASLGGQPLAKKRRV